MSKLPNSVNIYYMQEKKNMLEVEPGADEKEKKILKFMKFSYEMNTIRIFVVMFICITYIH